MILIKDLGMIFANENSKQKRRYGMYQCPKCGTIVRMQSFEALNSKTGKCKSCSSKTHGETKHKLYNTWKNQKRRCFTKTNPYYVNYGGRGITMSSEFANDFSVWLEYVESLDNCYKDGYTIDRINNDGNYERNNLRWTDGTTQKMNTRCLRKVNTSGYRGVCFCKTKQKYKAQIKLNYKVKSLGYHATAIEAAYAYDKFIIDNNIESITNGVYKNEFME